MRFPRIHRIRWDKPFREADTLGDTRTPDDVTDPRIRFGVQTLRAAKSMRGSISM